jgi:hypothetical protein
MAVSIPLLPDSSLHGRAFWEEAVRHLNDAYVLHTNHRYPASIASSMKAAELGLKSVLILDNVMGWWEKLLSVHDPLTTIQNTGRPVLTRHYDAINNADSALVTRVKDLESLAPRSQSSGRFEQSTAGVVNPEYPFLTVAPDAGGLIARLNRPETFFTEADSHNHYETAHRFIELLPTQYAELIGWVIPLPPAL